MPRTRFQRGDQADSDCTPGDEVNKPLLSAETGGNETVSASVAAQIMNSIEMSFTMAAGDPGGEDLGASSLFRCQTDCTVLGGNLSYKIRFRALDSACNELTGGSVDMDEADFTAIGLNLATATWDPPAAADRYQAEVIVTNGAGHNGPTETITLRTNNANAFFEIPDAPAGGGPDRVGGAVHHLKPIDSYPGGSIVRL